MVTLDQKRIGGFIAELRKARGLTQAALADMLCVTHQAVSKWECGAALPDMEVLLTMREVFGISLDDILDCRMPSTEPPAAPAGAKHVSACAGDRKETISEDRIEIYTAHTFESAVAVDECVIRGEAVFKSDLASDSLEVYGKGAFRGSVTTDRLSVDGIADVSKQVQCDTLNVQGMLSVGAAIVSDSFNNTGKTACSGGLQCDGVHNMGSLAIGGGIVVNSLFNAGQISVGGGIQADSVNNLGETTIGGGMATDAFTSSGWIALGGGLKANEIVILGGFGIKGGMSADSIAITVPLGVGGAGYVNAKSLIVKKPTHRPCGIVKFREIHADHAEIEHVHCELVDIKTGKVGDGCRITRLECGAEVEILPGAEVETVIKQ